MQRNQIVFYIFVWKIYRDYAHNRNYNSNNGGEKRTNGKWTNRNQFLETKVDCVDVFDMVFLLFFVVVAGVVIIFIVFDYFANVKWVYRQVFIGNIIYPSIKSDPHLFGWAVIVSVRKLCQRQRRRRQKTTTTTSISFASYYSVPVVLAWNIILCNVVTAVFLLYMVRFHVENIDFIRLRSTGQNTYSHQHIHITHSHTLTYAISWY